MDAFADIEQLTYGESASREIVTFILTFSLEMVISVERMDGEVITQIREDVHTFESVRSSVGLEVETGSGLDGVYILLSGMQQDV